MKKSTAGLHYFIGIDLAWSSRNSTGLAALRWDGDSATLIAPLPDALAYSDEEIAAYINEVVSQEGVVIAIDAPLTVPNEHGCRPGEMALNAVFARFHAGAHPANRLRLARYNHGKLRGEELLARLTALGIRHDPVLSPRRRTRQAFEAYPHPAMVTLFHLERVLKYKAKPTIPHAQRLTAFQLYQQQLSHLRTSVPALALPSSLLAEAHLLKKGKALKAYEDQLDAVFCAYLALYYWWWGTERCHIFGNAEQGYIIAPVDEHVFPRSREGAGHS